MIRNEIRCKEESMKEGQKILRKGKQEAGIYFLEDRY